MIRFSQLSRKLPGSYQLLHTLKSLELDQTFLYKKKLDPEFLSFLKKYDSDIFYCSQLEDNKKHLSHSHRAQLIFKERTEAYKESLHKAIQREPSIIAEKLVKLTETKATDGTLKVVVSNEESSTHVNESNVVKSEAEKSELAEVKLKILTEMNMRRSALEYELHSVPNNWMEDYETFDETELSPDSQYGTSEPNAKISKVPCYGCGANLHCIDPSIPGYLPSELMHGHHNRVLARLICQRCHFLKNYNTALKVQVNAEDYVNMISKIKNEYALAILMVDLTDFPCSIWPNIIDIIGEKRPVIVVGNKVDLLPQDSKEFLSHIRRRLEDALIESGLDKANIKYTCLISAKTNYGIEDLITCLYAIWGNNGDVYLLGNTNVGKSTLFNALLGSDYCKIRARNLIRRATSSEWPGTTLRMLKFPISRSSAALLIERKKRLENEERQRQAMDRLRRNQLLYSGRQPERTIMEHIGQTFEAPFQPKNESSMYLTDEPSNEKYFNENIKTFKDSKWFFDTPGVIQNDQIINILTSEELLYTIPKVTLWPRVFYMSPGQTLFLSGLGRVDYIGGALEMRLAVFASDKLSILITSTEKAEEIYRECLGTEILNVPRGDRRRLQAFPPLVRHQQKISFGNYNDFKTISAGDIVLSSAGWVSINIPPTETAHFHAWTPEGRGIFVRKPSLLPFAAELYRGKRKKFTPAYAQKEPATINFEYKGQLH